jgi:hypothetical protein
MLRSDKRNQEQLLVVYQFVGHVEDVIYDMSATV